MIKPKFETIDYIIKYYKSRSGKKLNENDILQLKYIYFYLSIDEIKDEFYKLIEILDKQRLLDKTLIKRLLKIFEKIKNNNKKFYENKGIY